MDVEQTQWVAQKLTKAIEKIKVELARLDDAIPYMPYDGRYSDVGVDRGLDWWTNGFWSGILWQAYHATKDDQFRQAAVRQENKLTRGLMEFRDIHHDVGFLFLLSSVAHYRLIGNDQSRRTGLHAASLLAGRYNINGNYLVAWNDDKPGWLIIDSMMNIPLLYWASRETADPRFRLMADRHGQTVAKYLVRADGSVGHIATFDAEKGSFLGLLGGQGYSDTSAWSRGNAWALYGFALAYHHNSQEAYLAIAQKIAQQFIANVTKTGFIPRVDFFAPADYTVSDTSAGLIGACGLLELATFVEEDTATEYRNVAIQLLQAAESQFGNWDLEEDGIIGGGTEAYHRPLTYEVPLIYNDYFFIEGLLRVQHKEFFIW